MASQFQHRVVGAVVVVALTVIFIPSIFDGSKKHYQSEFASIPLIPGKEQNNTALNRLPPANQAIVDSAPPVLANNQAVAESEQQPVITTTVNEPPPSSTATATQTTENSNVASATVTTPVNNTNVKPEVKPEVKQEVKPDSSAKPNSTTRLDDRETPKGRAYVIQVAALTNAAKVEEIKAKLSFANYSVFTVPATAVQGKTTRIFVGPDASRQRLEASLPVLEKLTGLKGVVKEHKVSG